MILGEICSQEHDPKSRPGPNSPDEDSNHVFWKRAMPNKWARPRLFENEILPAPASPGPGQARALRTKNPLILFGDGPSQKNVTLYLLMYNIYAIYLNPCVALCMHVYSCAHVYVEGMHLDCLPTILCSKNDDL